MLLTSGVVIRIQNISPAVARKVSHPATLRKVWAEQKMPHFVRSVFETLVSASPTASGNPIGTPHSMVRHQSWEPVC